MAFRRHQSANPSRFARTPGRRGVRSITSSSSSKKSALDPQNHGRETRKWLAFAAWFFVSGFVYWFFELAKPISRFVCNAFFTIVTPATDEPHAAWAFASHAAGLGLFLLITTRQSRWLLATAVGWLSALWGMGLLVPDEWHVLVAHTVGYAIQAGCLIAALGVFGGAVYLWTELLQFVKKIIKVYPEVREDLHEHPLLEKVIVSSAIADITSFAEGEDASEHLPSDIPLYSEELQGQSGANPALGQLALGGGDDAMQPQRLCFLCRGQGVASVAVCKEWSLSEDMKLLRQQESLPSVCTPMAALKLQQSSLERQLEAAVSELDSERRMRAEAQRTLGEANETIERLQAEIAAKSANVLLHEGTIPGADAETRAWTAILQREREARQHAEVEAQRRGMETLEAFADAEEASRAQAEMELRALKAEEILHAKLEALSSWLLSREDHSLELDTGSEAKVSSELELRQHKGDRSHKVSNSSHSSSHTSSHTGQANSHIPVSGSFHHNQPLAGEASCTLRIVGERGSGHHGSGSSGEGGTHCVFCAEGGGVMLGEGGNSHGKRPVAGAAGAKAKKEIKRLLEDLLEREMQLLACQDELQRLQEHSKSAN